MNLTKLFEMQRELDERIIKEKGLEGQNLLSNTVLALQVEIGELANEWRGFKFWSTRQTPKMFPLEVCSYCGEEVSYTRPSPFLADVGADMCEDCWNMTKKEYAASNGEYIPDFKDYPHFPKKKPARLLEEYVDCLHFFLSIARQLDLPAEDLSQWDDIIEGDTTVIFSELIYLVGLIIADQYFYKPIEDVTKWRIDNLRTALFLFYGLGEQRLGFTFEQIAEAYAAKNAVNHERQSTGY